MIRAGSVDSPWSSNVVLFADSLFPPPKAQLSFPGDARHQIPNPRRIAQTICRVGPAGLSRCPVAGLDLPAARGVVGRNDQSAQGAARKTKNALHPFVARTGPQAGGARFHPKIPLETA